MSFNPIDYYPGPWDGVGVVVLVWFCPTVIFALQHQLSASTLKKRLIAAEWVLVCGATVYTLGWSGLLGYNDDVLQVTEVVVVASVFLAALVAALIGNARLRRRGGVA